MPCEIAAKDVKEFFERNKSAVTQEELNVISSVISRIEHAESAKTESRSLSEDLKLRGNASFKEADFGSAIEFYSKSIEADPSNYLVYSNRALVYQKMNENERAIKDCLEGIRIEPSFAKFYIRLAMIYSGSDRARAHEYCLKGLEYEPNNKNLRDLAESTKPEDEKSVGSLDPSTLGDMLKNKDLQDMVKNFVKDKSPEELSRMMSDVLGKLRE